LAGFYRGWDDVPGESFVKRRDMADPMRSVATLRSHTLVWVIGDPRDRQVTPALWRGWIAAARSRGLTVMEESTAPSPGHGPWAGRETFHAETGLAVRMAGACASDANADSPKRQVLPKGLTLLRPLLVNHGQAALEGPRGQSDTEPQCRVRDLLSRQLARAAIVARERPGQVLPPDRASVLA
jgi:hypothetical protein